MRWGRKEPLKLTVVDTIEDTEWSLLDNDEQRLMFVVERRQLGRCTVEEYQQDLADWRRGITMREKLRP